MSFSDTVFLFFLALVLFGPKKLPEMARQAGRLLAELRRASNEFKSQIETELAHLETEKKPSAQTVLPPSPPPQGTVASLSPSQAPIDAVPHQLEAPVSREAPAAEAASDGLNPAASPSAAPLTEAVADHDTAASQESHV
jgi:sec-independent protein translocase protein TatB